MIRTLLLTFKWGWWVWLLAPASFFSQALVALCKLILGLKFFAMFRGELRERDSEGRYFLICILPWILGVAWGILVSSDWELGWREGRSSLQILILPAVVAASRSLTSRSLSISMIGCLLLELLWATVREFHLQFPAEHRWHGHLYEGTDGLFTSLICLVCIYQACTQKKKIWWFSLAAVALGFCLLTRSRAPFYALFILIPLLILLLYRNRNAWLGAGLLVIILAIAAPFFSQRFYSVLSDAWQQRNVEHSRESIGNRYQLWKGAMLIFWDSNGLGTGYGDFKRDLQILQSTQQIGELENTMHAHSIYFHSLMCAGIPGIIGLGFSIVLIIRGLWRLRHTKGVVLAGVVLIHFLLTGAFDAHFEHSEKVLFYLFVVALVICIHRECSLNKCETVSGMHKP